MVQGLGGAPLEILGKGCDQLLRLPDYDVIGVTLQFPAAAGNGPAHHRAESAGAAPSQDVEQAVFLHQHAADQRHVGPRQIGIRQGTHSGIDEPLCPVGRQQGSDREQP